ncbi:cellulose synthase/poly-beta-1,6-N-acetylglucosamine synthase-like glycosyltransferase/spore germination protein YaaH/peptidoglycan/xylan/chitin deacetylase (PgdA/CDA1 family) [Sphingomonas kyeonggiensis]|uniref:Chitooligosaccharide deacetylase n=1 Tax=Sphingomonas kyeonggiensis TaxID=1268553 RepID=A0A7W7K396_9SPHN|nr:glycosyltransferase [Sphingomonas kyeonggiensis]MBB4840219.1 cellulose synthase/poly-beta-1,6-N-acetylglucosamine synthase-like glycosyltransferase/spore germination protein YaaH/peptidoglycan/xylan/chitin deacetylase (PgdA/CDA1 family) [Sphingomonas kyeonggiensis]
MERPIFFDASGKRNRWTMRAFFALLLVIVLAAGAFAMTVVRVPTPGPLAMAMEHPQPRSLKQQANHLRHSFASWLPRGKAHASSAPLSVGFYVPWDDASRASLRRHVNDLDWVVPSLYSVTGGQHAIAVTPDPQFDTIIAGATKRPKVLPMVQNATGDNWDSAGAAALLRDPKARAAFLDSLQRTLVARKADGAVFDFEELPTAAQPGYLALLHDAHARFAAAKMSVSVTVPAQDDDWNMKAYAAATDKLILMDYDEHAPVTAPGPIASQAWFVNQMNAALTQVPADKLIVGIANYGYNWTAPGKADPISIEEAWLIAHDSDATVTFDKASGNQSFAYEENGTEHTVWMADATTAWNQLRAANIKGVGGVALWRLGSEDSNFWPALAAAHSGKIPDLRRIEAVGDVDVEGSGEILRITSTPSVGARTIVQNPNGLIVDESFQSLPTPYVVTRTGYMPGKVALTFDDGPDPDWTPKILDILKAKQVTGTFFMIGENAMAEPFLVRRVVDEGNEIGSHTFTHPNLALASARGTRIELNATQRLLEAYTGRSVRLFRAPYFGDAEPTTADELIPALTAQRAGYTNVGLHVDPNDWQRPGTDEIVNTVLREVEAGNYEQSGQIILLHDGGGDRSQTIAALPRIIDALRAKGYQFVPVSQLAGLTRDQVMPEVKGADLAAVRTDVGIFLVAAIIGFALKWLFFVAIALGIARALVLAALAVNGNRRKNRPVAPAIDQGRFVSVLIPAYNEAKVIENSIRRVLASEQVNVEVIVLDDGSKDGTSDVVRNAFSAEPRVKLLTLENGGKARALNKGLEIARGDIVIALDADTQFEPLTIARLARWFEDDEIGAIAGNAKVGNRINLVTRWQAVEYVTSQNLERRALASLDAIMVVPGAVGAWRKAALDDVGGYPVDTLAEDQDLTIAIQRKGWRVGYDIDAVAWTEAPESFGALAKQRFRWAFGTLQCLWKHRAILRTRKPAGLALVGIPQAWVFQIAFALISPLIDAALLVSILGTALRVYQHGWAQTESDVIRMGIYWVSFMAIDYLCGWIAYRMERREKRYPGLLLLAQRFVYRQLMYWVVIRAVANALRGPWVGWGKLERSGRVEAQAVAEPEAKVETRTPVAAE